MNTEPQIEPVTDEDHDAFQRAYNDTRVTGGTPYVAFIAAMKQDRRRVAERQAGRGRDEAIVRKVERSEIERLRAEVEMLGDKADEYWREGAKLRAACVAKDAALKAAVTLVRDRVPSGPDLHNACAALDAALSPDAGKGWIDATGAVGAVALGAADGSCSVARGVPDDWAGSPVVIVRVAK